MGRPLGSKNKCNLKHREASKKKWGPEGCLTKCFNKLRENREKTASLRFYSKINKVLDKNSCWEWSGRILPSGYGEVSRSDPSKKQYSMRSHRQLWQRVFKTNKFEMTKLDIICHKCDNTKCCRPSHLFLGTPKDNALDASRKERSARKLSIGKVKFIRNLYATGTWNNKQIAKMFNVSRGCIYHIIKRNTWTHC